MHLLSLNLQAPSAINNAVYGNFSGAKAHEFVVSRGRILELLRPDEYGKAHKIVSVEIFGIIRSILPFRLTGATKDYLIIGSDSGKVIILEFNPDTNKFETRHCETFGKTGCRRITPGQFVAVDPKGRAIMIAAVEKQKLVYVMNRDASSRLTISSPLEAHRSQTILFDVIGVDVGFENPVFACIECDYSDADADPSGEAALETKKNLVYYELDLGLNHVIRKWSEEIPRGSNMLIPVPGGTEGPGGVLICLENWVYYKHEGHETLAALIPRRQDFPNEKSILLVSYSSHKQKDMFFTLVQSEYGDLYKIALEYSGSKVTNMMIKFFDTIPVANAMCITKVGLLFSASEFGNHYTFRFQSIGEGDDTAESRAMDLSEVKEDDGFNGASLAPRFGLRKLTNLEPVDEMESLAPIIDLKVADLAKEETYQMYALCGRGNRSSLRILRHGLEITEMAVSELPGDPYAVWCMKERHSDAHDKFIIVAFKNATVVLSIGEVVEEVTDSQFLDTANTILVRLMEDDSFLQIHENGIRHIKKSSPVTEWKAPGKKTIKKATANTRQVIIALAGGELIYFELSPAGELVEITSIELGVETACLDVGEVPEGHQRFHFLAVGGWDNTVRLLSLDPSDMMSQKSTQAVPSTAESLCLAEMQDDSGTKSLYLNVGLNNGVLQRTEVDNTSGNLTDTRTRFLGSRGVKLFRVTVHGRRGILAVSSRSWLTYNYQSRLHITPLSYESLRYASNFSSDEVPEGIAAVTGNTLRILTVDRLGEVFNQQKIPLQYTPRKFIIYPQCNKNPVPNKRLVIIESDHNEYNAIEKQKIRVEHESASSKDMMDVEKEAEENTNASDANTTIPKRGPIPGKPGKWASCIRVFDPVTSETLGVVELEEDEAAFAIGSCVFHDRGGEEFIIVGTAKGLTMHPLDHKGGFLRVYRLIDGRELVLVHVTPVEGIPRAICSFQGRALISVGSVLRIYDLGKRKLLRKCENKNFPTAVNNLATAGDRIYASDTNESFHMLKYKRQDNQMIVFADDSTPRFVTTQVLLDYDTLAGADKFGNVFVCRLPSEVSDDVENPTGNRILWDGGILNGAPNKLEQVAMYHSGELVTSMVRSKLVPGGSDALIYGTVVGGIGALVPFESREDIDFCTHLEMYMRQESPSLCGRDHLSYRSYFIPVKDVTDGDLCEQFGSLSHDKQMKIAQDLDRTPGEVLKKLEDIRNRLM